MRRYIWFCTLLIAIAYACPLLADPMSYTGTFLSDDYVFLQPFHVATPGTVTFHTFSYAGGTNSMGTTIAAGGFDPVLSLFDGAGNFLASNNDGPCGTVGADPATFNCFDSFLTRNLSSGAYTVALTENDNLVLGPNLTDSFSQVGNGNFSCPEFLGVAGAFCDASPAHRNGSFALDIITPKTSPVPEPSSWFLLMTGILSYFIVQSVESRRSL